MATVSKRLRLLRLSRISKRGKLTHLEYDTAEHCVAALRTAIDEHVEGGTSVSDATHRCGIFIPVRGDGSHASSNTLDDKRDDILVRDCVLEEEGSR